MRIAFVEHFAGIQQHRALPNFRKQMFNFVVLHHAVLRDYPFQKQPESGNVPLTVAQLVKKLTLGDARKNLERRIKRTARSEYAKVLVEYEKRFPDGVDDRLGERSGIPVFDKWLTIGHWPPAYRRTPRATSEREYWFAQCRSSSTRTCGLQDCGELDGVR